MTQVRSDAMGLGAFVRTRRKARRLSQRDLAELAGVGVRFVSELERGKSSVRLDHVQRLLAVLGKRLGLVDRERPDAPAATDEAP